MIVTTRAVAMLKLYSIYYLSGNKKNSFINSLSKFILKPKNVVFFLLAQLKCKVFYCLGFFSYLNFFLFCMELWNCYPQHLQSSDSQIIWTICSSAKPMVFIFLQFSQHNWYIILLYLLSFKSLKYFSHSFNKFIL